MRAVLGRVALGYVLLAVGCSGPATAPAAVEEPSPARVPTTRSIGATPAALSTRTASDPTTTRSVTVALSRNVSDEPVTGRLLLFVTDKPGVEPRLVADSTDVAEGEDRGAEYAPMFGMDVEAVDSESRIVMGGADAPGYPFETLEDLPDGDYTVQAVLNVYTLFPRADGNKMWAHLDQWEGQQPQTSPGNLYSEPQPLHIARGVASNVTLTLSRRIQPIELKPDTRFTKRFKMKSDVLSAFWGRDIEVGAVVQLPSTYYDHPRDRFPVLYAQGHFVEQDAYVVSEQKPEIPPGVEHTPDRLARLASKVKRWNEWHGKDAPQLVVVTFQHPTVFYDSSYLVNSPVAGPYGDMVMNELIPKIESDFRIIREPWARVLTGGSIGGWQSAALQIFHPDFFGGTWSGCPDPVDLRNFYGVNIHDDSNAFVVPDQRWAKTDRVFARDLDGTPLNTTRRVSQLHRALGSQGRSGELYDNFSASWGPAGPDGFPRLIWDHRTGTIDREVAQYWRDHFDLRLHVEKHWPQIGKQLAGKLRFFCGDADQYALNQSMYGLQATLESLKSPAYGGWFYYAPRLGHDRVYDRDALFKDMLRTIASNAPRGTNLRHLHVPAKAVALRAR